MSSTSAWITWKANNSKAVAIYCLQIVSIILSVLIRLPALGDSPAWFRAAQTEMTVYWFVEEGIDLLHYQTPVYGPPFTIPFEFPLYQALSAVLVNLGIQEIGLATRLSALIFFYISAALVYLISKKLIADRTAVLIIANLYLWLPYNIIYSVEPLIDYCALALALGFFYGFIVWLESPRLISLLLVSTIILGSLGMMVKGTTTPIFYFPILALFISRLDGDLFNIRPRLRQVFLVLWRQKTALLGLVLSLAIPFGAGILWTQYTDQVKSGSIFTTWLMSGQLHEWFYGTIAMRFDAALWIVRIFYIVRLVTTIGLVLFSIPAIIEVRKQTRELKYFLWAMAIGIGIIFLVFFNLFLHEYYYISLVAPLTILIGYGIFLFIQKVMHSSIPWMKYSLVIFLGAFVLIGAKDYLNYRKSASELNSNFRSYRSWASDLLANIDDDAWVAVLQYDWDPVMPYILERKTMVITHREVDKPICTMLRMEEFKLVVDLENRPDLATVLSCFAGYQEISPDVYQVSH